MINLKNKLTEWITSFVEVPNAKLGNFAPCPYARAARVNNQIEIIESDANDLYIASIDCLPLLDNKEVEYVNSVKMNFSHCGLLIIQKLDKLNNAADKLREQGYYTQWDNVSLDSVVNWRYIRNEVR